MIFIKKIFDLALYGNFWIAACALAMMLQTERILIHSFSFNPLNCFVFFSTLFLYAVHRIVGIAKLSEYFDIDRYAVIAHYKKHIQLYAGIGFLGIIIYFWFLSRAVQWSLVIPGILSLAYVIPFLSGKRRRIRDFNHIKIFLIAIVWAWISVLLPALEYGIEISTPILLVTLERVLFIFAITLPFDIRDLKVDAHSSVKTIPATIGVKASKRLGLLSLVIMAGLVIFNFQIGFYSSAILYGLLFSILSTAVLIVLSTPERHDYFYSGLIDGTMIFQFLFIEGCIYLISTT